MSQATTARRSIFGDLGAAAALFGVLSLTVLPLPPPLLDLLLGTSLVLSVLIFLVAADVIVVATRGPLSLADAYACLKVLASRHGVRRAYVPPNNVRSATEADEVCSRLAALVERFLGVELALLLPLPYDLAVGAAAAAGTPLVAHAPDSPAARAIRQAARRIDALARAPTRDERLRGFPLTVEGGQ